MNFSTRSHTFLWMSCEAGQMFLSPLRHCGPCFSTLNSKRGSDLLLLLDTTKCIYVQAMGWVLRAGNPQPTRTSSLEVGRPLLCGDKSYSTASLSRLSPCPETPWAPTTKHFSPPLSSPIYYSTSTTCQLLKLGPIISTLVASVSSSVRW